jgi:hypothetical protein
MAEGPPEREFTRVAPAIGATLTSGERVLTGQVRDISLKGAFVLCDSAWDVGTECRVVVQIGPAEESEFRTEALGSVARTAPDGLAVQFHDLVGVESYWNLRNLILLNSEDPDRAEKELASHLGLHPRD